MVVLVVKVVEVVRVVVMMGGEDEGISSRNSNGVVGSCGSGGGRGSGISSGVGDGGDGGSNLDARMATNPVPRSPGRLLLVVFVQVICRLIQLIPCSICNKTQHKTYITNQCISMFVDEVILLVNAM